MYCIVYSILYTVQQSILHSVQHIKQHSVQHSVQNSVKHSVQHQTGTKQGPNRENFSFEMDNGKTDRHTDGQTETKVHLLSCAIAANNQTDLHKLHLGPIVDFLKILDKFEFKCRFVKIKCRFIKFKSRFVKFKGRFVIFYMRG